MARLHWERLKTWRGVLMIIGFAIAVVGLVLAFTGVRGGGWIEFVGIILVFAVNREIHKWFKDLFIWSKPPVE